MTNEKFINDTKIVLKFIQLYCDDKHKNSEKKDAIQHLIYRDKDLNIDLKYNLCEACTDTFKYSYKALQECPHEEKPSCRKCNNPCYDRPRWKHLASIMRYSGMQLGFVKIKRLFKIKN